MTYLDTTRAGLQNMVGAGEPIMASWQQDGVHLYGQRLSDLLRATR